MTNLKHPRVLHPRPNSVSIETFTYTTHVVEVDLADLLGTFDPTDRVVLNVRTPSGRDKRVTIGGGFLVAPHHTEEAWS